MNNIVFSKLSTFFYFIPNIDYFLICYLLFMNIISFILMFVDKKKAIHHKWRIAEISLIEVSILGGSIGMLLGMYLFHHKTKDRKSVV